MLHLALVLVHIVLAIVCKLNVGGQLVSFLLSLLFVYDSVHLALFVVEIPVQLLLWWVDMLEALVLKPGLVALLHSLAHVVELEVGTRPVTDVPVLVDGWPQFDALFKCFVHRICVVCHNGVLNWVSNYYEATK